MGKLYALEMVLNKYRGMFVRGQTKRLVLHTAIYWFSNVSYTPTTMQLFKYCAKNG